MVLLSRNEAYQVRALVTVAPVTTRLRGIPVEVPLGPDDGLPRPCAINLDTITTITRTALQERISALRPDRIRAVEAALHFALGLESCTAALADNGSQS